MIVDPISVIFLESEVEHVGLQTEPTVDRTISAPEPPNDQPPTVLEGIELPLNPPRTDKGKAPVREPPSGPKRRDANFVQKSIWGDRIVSPIELPSGEAYFFMVFVYPELVSISELSVERS